MQHILLYPNINKDRDLSVTDSVAERLLDLGLCVYLSDTYELPGRDVVRYHGDVPKACELLVVIGGDGTVIDAVGLALARDLPILGINLGKVGYLAEIEPTELEVLSGLLDSSYTVENKLLLEAAITIDGKTEDCGVAILNDLVVSRKIEDSIATVSVGYNGRRALDYRADGVIVSTPQGSTAYALSCGGPMLSQELDAISMTPICPHSFLNRSMVFPDSAQIQLHNTGEHPLVVMADGRFVGELLPQGYCSVYRSDKKIKFLSLKKDGHLRSIFRKLRRIENF